MKFLQLTSYPDIGYQDALCFGINVPCLVPSYGLHRTDLYKFRDHPDSNQNQGIGWFCEHFETQFKLELVL